MSGMNDGLTVGGDAAVSYGGSGRGRWKMEMPVEGAKMGTFFRVLRVDQVPGLKLPTNPIFYYTHTVSNAALGSVNKAADFNFKQNIPCLGSLHAPIEEKLPDGKIKMNWSAFDPAGLAECEGINLPSGITLHSLDPIQRFLFVVYAYNHGVDDVNEIAFWDWKVGKKKGGVFNRLSAAYEKAVMGGATLDNMIWEFITIKEDTGYMDFDVNVHRADPNTPYGDKYPFGESQLADIAAKAPTFLKNFLPWATADEVRRRLKLDDSSASTPPPLQSAMAGPTAEPESIV